MTFVLCLQYTKIEYLMSMELMKNEAEALKISRQLNQGHKADLLGWVRLAYAAENSVRESMGVGSKSKVQLQKSCCKGNLKRST